MVNELNHRVKNSLATVQAIAAQTFRGTESQATAAFTERIMALARAHDLLTEEGWEGANLGDVIAGTVEAHQNESKDRIRIEGPRVRLTPKTALSLAMVTHELVTNAVKYGALSNGSGGVDVTWSVVNDADGRLHVLWRESGGPPVVPPTRKGFGSRLVERGLAAELGGEAQIAYEIEGVVCTIDAPLAAMAEQAPRQ